MNEKSNLESIIGKLTEKNALFDEDIDSSGLDIQQKRFRNQRYFEDTINRRKLTRWASKVVTVYLILMCLILCFNTSIIKLGDNVLIALLGTTTVNVLGLMYIVLKGYFDVDDFTP